MFSRASVASPQNKDNFRVEAALAPSPPIGLSPLGLDSYSSAKTNFATPFPRSILRKPYITRQICLRSVRWKSERLSVMVLAKPKDRLLTGHILLLLMYRML